MEFHVDFLFKAGAGYDELVSRIQANPRYVLYVFKQDKMDKRTKAAKLKGWVEIRHKQHAGVIKLVKRRGTCTASVKDESQALQLIGALTSWVARNAGDLVSGLDIRIL